MPLVLIIAKPYFEILLELMYMPIYEYQCQICHEREEILQRFDAKAPEECPHCGAKNSLTKIVSSSAFHLKGGGWYKDLYASKKTDSQISSTPGEKKHDKKGSTN